MKFQIGNEVSVKSYPVENLKGKVSIKNVFSALKKMRKDVDSVLNKYVEEEKQRSVNENSEGGRVTKTSLPITFVRMHVFSI